MKNESLLIWEAFNTPNTISLNDIYGDLEDIPENEALYHAVDPEEGNVPLPIIILNTQQLKSLTTYNNDTTVFDAYQEFADRDQKRLVNGYRKSREYNDSYIVIDQSTVIDGYHRIIAAILNGDSLKAVDISDLPEV